VPGATHSGIRSPVLDELAPQVIAFFDAALRGPRVLPPVLVRDPVGRFTFE
jgi:hypothetical protein